MADPLADQLEQVGEYVEETTVKERALVQIAEQAATGTPITPSAEGWVEALPELDDIACEWTMEDSLLSSYLWWEDGAYYATDLPSGLEHREDVPLEETEALALLQSGLLHQPVEISEVEEDG